MLLQKNYDFFETPSQIHCIKSDDRAFLYGDGCFTTACVREGQIMYWQRHQQRLQEAIAALFLEVNWLTLMQQLDHFMRQLAQRQLCEGTLKILISRGSSPRGYGITKQVNDVYYYFYPQILPTQPTILERVGVIEQALPDDFAPLKGIKTLNRLTQVWLKQYATSKNWHEALCFNRFDNLVESIASNVFVLIDAVWHTPDLNLNGINGVMRQEIISRMQKQRIQIAQSQIGIEQLRQASALFLCNALYPMQIVQRLMLPRQQLRQKIISSYDAVDLNQVECRQLFLRLQL